MDLIRASQSSVASVITLEVFSLGIGVRPTVPPAFLPGYTQMRMGFVQDPNNPYQDGDAIGIASWEFDGAAVTLGLGGSLDDGIGDNPGPSVTVAAPSNSVVEINNEFTPVYWVWVGPAWFKLYFSDANLITEWWDNPTFAGTPLLRNSTPATPGADYAAMSPRFDWHGSNDQQPCCYCGEWKVDNGPAASPSAPYPFAPIQGSIAVGSGFRGAVKVG